MNKYWEKRLPDRELRYRNSTDLDKEGRKTPPGKKDAYDDNLLL